MERIGLTRLRRDLAPDSSSTLDGEPDVTATLGELAGVVQEIADDLRQPGRVRIQVHGHAWQRDGQFLLPTLGDRAGGVHDMVHDG